MVLVVWRHRGLFLQDWDAARGRGIGNGVFAMGDWRLCNERGAGGSVRYGARGVEVGLVSENPRMGVANSYKRVCNAVFIYFPIDHLGSKTSGR